MAIGNRCNDPTHVRRNRTKTNKNNNKQYVYSECVTCKHAKDRELASKNSAKRTEKTRQWRLNNPGRKEKSDQDRYDKLRNEIFGHYGNFCACCGLSVRELLTIDHIDPRTKTDKRGGVLLFPELIQLGFPDGFQTLCRTCNSGKNFRSACPHQEEPPEPLTKGGRWLRNVKLDAMNVYGGSCVCCGEQNIHLLTLHHINGDGRNHRTLLTGTRNPGSSLYTTLKKLGWPTDPPLEVRCYNCNWGADLPNGCPCGRKYTTNQGTDDPLNPKL